MPDLRPRCTKFYFRWGSAPDTPGELAALPQPLAVFKGATFRGGMGKGMEMGEGKEKEGKKVGNGVAGPMLKCFLATRLGKCMRQPRSCLLSLPNIHRLKNPLSNNSNNSALTTPPHLQYVAMLPCNLSLTACFADINVSNVV